MHQVTHEELERVVGAGEPNWPEKKAMNGIDWGLSYVDSGWKKSDCAGRFGYIGHVYGWSTGVASTLLLAAGRAKHKLLGVAVAGVTGLYGARLQSNYVDNCKANQAADGG